MARKLKVYQGSLNGRDTCCIAAYSWQHVREEILRQARRPISLNHLRDYWSVSGNDGQIKAAMSEPGRLFRTTGTFGSKYEPY